jgi:hypothetical protein
VDDQTLPADQVYPCCGDPDCPACFGSGVYHPESDGGRSLAQINAFFSRNRSRKSQSGDGSRSDRPAGPTAP